MKTKLIATSAIFALLTTFGTAHANTTTKATNPNTHECKPPHDAKTGKHSHAQKSTKDKENKKSSRPEPPKDANGKPLPPPNAKNDKPTPPKDGCPPPKQQTKKSSIQQ